MAMDRSGLARERGERIGLFGGTFDPIHMGHLRCAQEVGEAFHLDQVIFILSALPPHKVDRAIISDEHRWSMATSALAGNPLFTLSDVEMRRGGRSYSIDTIAYYCQTLGGDTQLFFIMGADALCEIEMWKDYQQLFTLCDFIVISRLNFDPLRARVLHSEGFQKDGDTDRFLHPSGHSLYLHQVTPIGISSTEIRRAIKEGRSITYLVPSDVEEYIRMQGLYRT